MHTGGRGDEEEDWVPCRGRKKKESPISFRFLYQTLSGHIDFRSGKEKLRNWLPSPLEENRARMADGAVAQVGQIIVEYLLD